MGASTHAVPATLIAAGVAERTLPVTATVRGGALNATLPATSAATTIPSSGRLFHKNLLPQGMPPDEERANSAHG